MDRFKAFSSQVGLKIIPGRGQDFLEEGCHKKSGQRGVKTGLTPPPCPSMARALGGPGRAQKKKAYLVILEKL